ncbi:MAG: hypothetical protein DRP85_00965 [Candidatus Makaraimicrobium thalassicum]|nr:MAG: hypothetical protein DRP85_00965 [Candidatus Omnitrophota bacterium]
MKRYLQACEIGGSIYGRKRPAADRSSGDNNRRAGRQNLVKDYDRFYKRQAVAMRKIFQRSGI